MLTGECACIAGYGESCKHVFALLHFVENKVALGLNKTSTSKKQAWQETVSKKGEKIHQPVKMSQVSESGLKLHPEMVILGASVDGMVECSCCDGRCLQIKCPFSHREKTIEESVCLTA
jgi:uncharacterized protein YodC (DUF2158 family)